MASPPGSSQHADRSESPQSEYVLVRDDAENGDGRRLDLAASSAPPPSQSAPATASPSVAETAAARRQQRPEGSREGPTPRQRSPAPSAPAAAHPHGWWWEDPDRSIVQQVFCYVRHRPWPKKLLTVLVVATCAVVYADLFGLFWDGRIHSGIRWFLGWMHQNTVWAVFVFVGAFVVTTLVFIPPSLLIFGAGFVFADVWGPRVGIPIAVGACFGGSVVGANLAFLRARYMMRDLVKLFARRYPLIRAVDRGLKSDGFRVMLLLRLCSLVPFSALNYIGGVTGVRFGAFVLSMVGMLPSLVLAIILGATAGSLAGSGHSLSEDQRVAYIIWMSVLGGCGLLAVAMTVYLARKELVKEMERESMQAGSAQLGSSVDVKPIMDQEGWSENDVEEGVEARYKEGVDDEEWFWVWA